MFDSHLRHPYQKYFAIPIAKRLRHFSPNTLTLYALLTGIVASMAIDVPLVACAFLLLSGTFDTLDGTLARLKNQETAHGSLFDRIADRIVEAAVLIALYTIDPLDRALPTLLIFASIYLCITTYLLSKGSPGIIERFETFLFFFAAILFPTYFVPLAYLYTALVSLTVILRLYHILHPKRDPL